MKFVYFTDWKGEERQEESIPRINTLPPPLTLLKLRSNSTAGAEFPTRNGQSGSRGRVI